MRNVLGACPISVTMVFVDSRGRARLFPMMLDLSRSGIRPFPFEPHAWYDRVIRVVGGVLILTGFTAALIASVIAMFND